ncbi:hypothetical protein D3C73_1194330 [compost metagenome]
MGEHIKEAAHQRAAILVVLGRQRQPLGNQAVLLQARCRQLIKITRVQVHHPGCGRRWRLQGDQVVTLCAAQQFAAPIAQADVQPRVVDRIVIAGKQRRSCQHLRQQFGNHRMLQAGVAQHCPGSDASAKTDHQRRAGFAAVYQQRQQCLQAHVAQ